jgi:hypothetical protein
LKHYDNIVPRRLRFRTDLIFLSFCVARRLGQSG